MSAVATQLRAHPAADAFPIVQKTIDELAEDIAKSGQQFPITVSPDGLVIDGRHRWLACERLGIEPQVDVWDDATEDDIVDFVVSANLARYHLTPSQLAMAAEKLANLRPGGDPSTKVQGCTLEEAGDRLGVSRRSVASARTVRQNGTPALAEAVEQGEVSVNAASKIAKLPREEQPQTLDEIREAKAKPKDERPAWASPQKLDTDPDTSVPDPNTGDLDLGEDEVEEVEKSPKQLADEHPTVRWEGAMVSVSKFRAIVASVPGGIRELARDWGEKRSLAKAIHLRRLAEFFNEFANDLEDEWS